MFLKITDFTKKSLYSTKKIHFVDTISRQTYFWDTAVPWGYEKSHNVVRPNPDEDKYYLRTTNHTPIEEIFTRRFQS